MYHTYFKKKTGRSEIVCVFASTVSLSVYRNFVLVKSFVRSQNKNIFFCDKLFFFEKAWRQRRRLRAVKIKFEKKILHGFCIPLSLKLFLLLNKKKTMASSCFFFISENKTNWIFSRGTTKKNGKKMLQQVLAVVFCEGFCFFFRGWFFFASALTCYMLTTNFLTSPNKKLYPNALACLAIIPQHNNKHVLRRKKWNTLTYWIQTRNPSRPQCVFSQHTKHSPTTAIRSIAFSLICTYMLIMHDSELEEKNWTHTRQSTAVTHDSGWRHISKRQKYSHLFFGGIKNIA